VKRAELLRRIAASKEDLDDLVSTIDPRRIGEEGPDGGWSIKDHLAHLGTWAEFALFRVEERTEEHEIVGLTTEEYEPLGVDELNDIIRERHRRRPAGEVPRYLDDVWDRLFSAVSAVLQDRLDLPWLPEDPSRGSLADTVAENSFEHLEEHDPTFRALAEDR
jgi:DinB superfamily